MRRTIASTFCLIVAFVLPRQAAVADSPLAVIPDATLAFVYLPNIGALDAAYQQAINDLGLQPFLPAPQNSLIKMLQEYLPWLAELDDRKPLALVLLAADSPDAFGSRMALLVPAKDPATMLRRLRGDEAGGIAMTNVAGGAVPRPVTVMGTPAYAVFNNTHLILAQTPDVADTVLGSGKTIVGRLDRHELEVLSGLDLAIWADVKRFIEIAGPQVDALTGMLVMMQAAGNTGGYDPAQAQATKKQMDTLVSGTNSLCLGLSLGNAGLGFRGAMTAIPGSELAKQTQAVRTTSGPMFEGLLAENYVLAFSALGNPDALTEDQFAAIDATVASLVQNTGISAEAVKQIAETVKSMSRLARGMRGSIATVPSGADGALGISLVLETTDSRAFLDAASKSIEHLKNLAATTAGAELRQLAGALTYRPGAEQLDEIAVHQITFDVADAELPDVTEEELTTLKSILGPDGLTVRLASTDENTVVATIGGGAAHARRIIEQAKTQNAPLDGDAGIKKVSAHLPRQRAFAMYLAADNLVTLVQRIAAVLGQPMPPIIKVPINAPLAITQTGGDGWSRVDVLIPTDLIAGLKNMAMSAMMGPAPPTMTPNP